MAPAASSSPSVLSIHIHRPHWLVHPSRRFRLLLFAMDASSIELRTSMLEWDENEVHSWLSKLGFPQYEHQVKGVHFTPPVLRYILRLPHSRT